MVFSPPGAFEESFWDVLYSSVVEGIWNEDPRLAGVIAVLVVGRHDGSSLVLMLRVHSLTPDLGEDW